MVRAVSGPAGTFADDRRGVLESQVAQPASRSPSTRSAGRGALDSYSGGLRPSQIPATVSIQPDADGQSDATAGEAGGKVQQSCAGWESDPQSFSIRAAQNFAQDAFQISLSSADKVTCTGTQCVVVFLSPSGVPSVVDVDMSQVPGTVSATGWLVPAKPAQRCSYSYSCDASGALTFKRIGCQAT